MQERQNIAVFVDYDNIEIGVKSTLRREFDVSIPLDALKERGDIVAKFAYANWSRQEHAVRQMAENAVQMVQRLPSPRGDKNGADINLALDALEMAFTHKNVNAFAIVSGDSDFVPLVNKLKSYGKTIYIVGGKAFTSTILQQNCHEFISYESLLDDPRVATQVSSREVRGGGRDRDRMERADRGDRGDRRQRPAPLEVSQALPLVERALQVLRRRGVQPQLGLLKSTMLQLDPSFSERAFGVNAFSDFVEKLKVAGYIHLHGTEGRYTIEQAKGGAGDVVIFKKDDALQLLKKVLDIYRVDLEDGAPADQFNGWMLQIFPDFDVKKYGFQEFAEFLTFSQDNYLVRVEPNEQSGLIVYLGEVYTSRNDKYPKTNAVGKSSARREEPVEAPANDEADGGEETEQPAAEAKPARRTATKKRASTKKASSNSGEESKSSSSSGSSTVRRPRARKQVE